MPVSFPAPPAFLYSWVTGDPRAQFRYAPFPLGALSWISRFRWGVQDLQPILCVTLLILAFVEYSWNIFLAVMHLFQLTVYISCNFWFFKLRKDLNVLLNGYDNTQPWFQMSGVLPWSLPCLQLIIIDVSTRELQSHPFCIINSTPVEAKRGTACTYIRDAQSNRCDKGQR